MIEPKQEHTFLSKKRETELRKLPLPRFQATTTSSCTESDINKDCTFPQEGPISFPAKKEESQPPEVADVLSISFKKHQTFIFLYDDSPIPTKFDIMWNMLNVTVLQIYKFVDVEEVKKLTIEMPFVGVRTVLSFNMEDMKCVMLDKVAVIKDDIKDEVFLGFYAKNEFDFSIKSQDYDVYLIYQVMNDQLKDLLIHGEVKKREISITERLTTMVNPQRMMIKDAIDLVTAIWKIEQVIQKEEDKYSKTLQEKINERDAVKKRTSTQEYKAQMKMLKREMERLESEANLLSLNTQEEHEQLKMAEENNLIEEAVIDTKNKDIADLTAQVKKWQTNIENAIIEEKETSLQLKQIKKRLNEEEQQNVIQSQPAVSKAIVNIDGVEFEVLEPVTEKKEEPLMKEMIQLKEEYESNLCIICMENQRNVVYNDCYQLSCCSECMKSQFQNEKGKKIDEKKTKGFLKGSHRCPACNSKSKSITILEII